MMECCVCFDKVDVVGLRCQRCKDGIVCETCFKRMDTDKCPLCRYIHIEVEPPIIYIDPPRRSRMCCRLKVQHCLVSFCWTVIVGFTIQLVLQLYTTNEILNIVYMFLLGFMGMICLHCCLLTNEDCQGVTMPYDCCIIHDE